MSPLAKAEFVGRDRFPRVSGDEPPFSAMLSRIAVFSPRERG